MSPNLRVPLLTGVVIISNLEGGVWLGGADGGDESTDVTGVTGVRVPRGVVWGVENRKIYNNVANISETPFYLKEKNNFTKKYKYIVK